MRGNGREGGWDVKRESSILAWGKVKKKGGGGGGRVGGKNGSKGSNGSGCCFCDVLVQDGVLLTTLDYLTGNHHRPPLLLPPCHLLPPYLSCYCR